MTWRGRQCVFGGKLFEFNSGAKKSREVSSLEKIPVYAIVAIFCSFLESFLLSLRPERWDVFFFNISGVIRKGGKFRLLGQHQPENN